MWEWAPEIRDDIMSLFSSRDDGEYLKRYISLSFIITVFAAGIRGFCFGTKPDAAAGYFAICTLIAEIEAIADVTLLLLITPSSEP